MTPDQYRAALATCGLSQLGAARLFGVDGRTSRRWARGELLVPRAVQIALAMMIRDGTSAEDAAALLRAWGDEQHAA